MRAIPIISCNDRETRFHPTITDAAVFYGVSNYTVVNAYFTDRCLDDGTCFDLALGVSAYQERKLRKAWLNARSNSKSRDYYRSLIDGKFEEKL